MFRSLVTRITLRSGLLSLSQMAVAMIRWSGDDTVVRNVVDERVAYLACIAVAHLYLDVAAVLAEADAPVEEGVVRYFV